MEEYTKTDVAVATPTTDTIDIPAFGGRLDVSWDPNATVTQWGGMCYLASFLRIAQLLDRLVADAPFVYGSNNSPGVRNVVGTMVLSILCGHTRYLHIERLRNDGVCAGLLGMTKIVSETCVRRALKEHCDQTALEAWLLKHEREVSGELLKYPYVIDVDNTVKPIYGHQEGAEIGYNPQKPGRPSHNFHTYFIGIARITLGVDVLPGKRHSGGCGMPGLWAFLDSLPADSRPRFIRGDVGYGTETVMCDAESRSQRCLLKIKRTWGVRGLLRQYENSGEWRDCGFGSCLADDMGLGKTVQVISLLLERAKDGPSLVFAPSSVCGNWRNEIERFAPTLRVVMAMEEEVALAQTRSGDVVVASYGYLLFHEKEFASVVWNGLVLDEAQAIKNDASKRAKAEEEGEANRMSILAELTRLRRFCRHPSLVLPGVGVPSAKMEALVELLEGLHEGHHRALVFSQFTDYLALVRKMLDAHGWNHLDLDGSTPTLEREKLVNAFQGGEGDFSLISLKAGGTGLNLTAANYVILLDPWWNPAVENQAADRAHRIGQRNPVTVYRLISSDTVEARVIELHHEKQAIAEDVLDGTFARAAHEALRMMRQPCHYHHGLTLRMAV